MSASKSRRRPFAARSRRSAKRWGSYRARPRLHWSSTAPQGVSGSAIRLPRARLSRSSPPSAFRHRHWRGPTPGERSGGYGVRKETATTALSSLHLVQRLDRRDELLRRFVEAARRAQIVTIVNLAHSEAELGELFTAELCEAYEAEIAFVLAARDGRVVPALVGAHGLTPDQCAALLDDERCVHALTLTEPQVHEGDLLGIGIRQLVLAPFAGEVDRGVVGVARLYDEPFDDGEVALLEAVSESIKHALERIHLGKERDVLLACERAARREAEATAERLVRLQSITGTMLSDLRLQSMLRELLERLREVVAVDVAAILLVDGLDDSLSLCAAAGGDAYTDAAIGLAHREGLVRLVLHEHRTIEIGTATDDGNRADETFSSLIAIP